MERLCIANWRLSQEVYLANSAPPGHIVLRSLLHNVLLIFRATTPFNKFVHPAQMFDFGGFVDHLIHVYPISVTKELAAEVVVRC